MSLKYKFLLRFGAVALISIVFIETAHAANPFGDILSGIGNDIASFSGFVITLVTVLSFVFFMLLNAFLNPTVIFDLDNGNLMNTLNMIWQLSRDIMNIIFAFVLAGVAVYMVITAKKEFIKEYIGKFVLAVILVNFSWFFPRVVLDVSHVIAATIYDIPLMLLGSNPQFCAVREGVAVKSPYRGITDVAFFVETCPAGVPNPPVPCFNVTPPVAGVPTPPPAINPGSWECIGGSLVCFIKQDIDFNTVAGHASILNGLIINHAALDQMANVPINIFPGVTPFDEQLAFLVKVGLQLFLAVSLLFPLAAMTIAMFIRIPILWITIAFMPFVFLAFIGGDKLQQFIGDKGPKTIWETFLKFAFLPAIVAIPLAVGFILIQAGSQVQCTGGFGSPLAGTLAAMRLNIPMASNIFDLMWLLMAQLILWIGVFSVLKGTPIVGGISEKIQGFGKTMGRLAWKIPATATVIPGTTVTPYQAMRAFSPAGLEQAITSSGNLGAALEEIDKRAHGDPAALARIHVPETAKAITSANATQRHNLNAALESGNAENIIKAIQAINPRLSGINRDNLATFLRDLRIPLGTSVGDGPDKINLTDETIRRLEGTHPASGTPPPATPPPAAPPASPPPAAPPPPPPAGGGGP